MAGDGGGGCVSAAWGTGSAVLFVGAGGHEHGRAVARVVALGGAGAASGGCTGLGTRIDGAGNGKQGAARGGRGTWTWEGNGVCGGAQGSGNGRGGTSGGHGGASESRSGASDRVRRGGAVGSLRAGAGSVARAASGSATVCWIGPLRGAIWASPEALVGPRGPRVVPPGTAGGGFPLSMDLPRSGVAPGEVDAAAVVAVATGPVVVPGGGGPGGPLCRGRRGRADTVLGGGGGRPLVVGGLVGWSAWWVVLPSHALVLFVHGGLWPGGVG